MNLLKNRLALGIVHSAWFPLTAQIFLLVVFIAIIDGGWGISTDDADFAKILRNTNLSNLLVWSYWWPLIIIVSIILGRGWCTVCPMELVSFIATKIGLKRPIPTFFKSGWIITLFYAAVLLIGINTLAIHRLPHNMAIYMLILLGVALVCGLVFQKRAFCSYVCPVGHLLGLYAMVSPFQWRSADKQVCRDCKTKDCVDTHRHYHLTGRSCTSNLYPATIQNNQDCLLCTQCAKACPNNNLAFNVIRPFSDFFKSVSLTTAQQAFVMIVSGFVVYEILSEWSRSKAILTWVPTQVNNALHMGKPLNGFIAGTIMFVVFPALLYMGIWLIAKVISRTPGRTIMSALSLLLIPTMASAHIMKSCLKIPSRIPYWTYVCKDPVGVKTAQLITDKSIVLDKTIPNAMQPGLTWLMVVLLGIALIVSLLILSRAQALKAIDRGGKVAVLIGILLYWGVFMVTIMTWRF